MPTCSTGSWRWWWNPRSRPADRLRRDDAGVPHDGIVIPAETTGKYKTGAQIIAVISLVLNYHLETIWMSELGIIALWVAMLLGVYSAVQYFARYWKKLN